MLDAITRGKIHLAKFILDAGESSTVNTKDFKGKTPLIRSCYIRVRIVHTSLIMFFYGRGRVSVT